MKNISEMTVAELANYSLELEKTLSQIKEEVLKRNLKVKVDTSAWRGPQRVKLYQVVSKVYPTNDTIIDLMHMFDLPIAELAINNKAYLTWRSFVEMVENDCRLDEFVSWLLQENPDNAEIQALV